MALSIVLPEQIFNGSDSAIGASTFVPAFVQRYIMVTTILKAGNDTMTVMIALACVNWLQLHQHKDWYGSPVEVWHVSFIHPLICIQMYMFL